MYRRRQSQARLHARSAAAPISGKAHQGYKPIMIKMIDLAGYTQVGIWHDGRKASRWLW